MDFKKRELAVVIVLAGIIVSFFIKENANLKSFSENNQNNELEKIESVAESNGVENFNDECDNAEEIYVHICGAVYEPGLYIMADGDRVADVVEMAGGVLSSADLERVNLAAKLEDEDKIYIYEVGEESEGSSQDLNSGININSASSEELQKISGVGPKTAENIIKYREENRFKKIEDIKNVKGIGDKTFDSIKEYITVK